MMTPSPIPGSAIYTGTDRGEGSVFRYLAYDAVSCEVSESLWPPPPQQDGRVDWYDFRGLGDTARAIQIAQLTGMHDMALEGALDVSQRPKYEEFDDAFVFTLDAIDLTPQGLLTTQKITIYWTREIVVTFQEFPDDVFLPIVERLEKSFGRIRKRGSAYLAYALIDKLVDDYTDRLLVLEGMIDTLEELILKGGHEADVKRRIYKVKVIVNRIRRSVLPLRDAVSRWLKSEHPFKEPKLGVYMRDLYDNTKRASDFSDDYVTRTNDLYQLFTSELTIRTNKVVQLLTVVSTIFIPLTFLTGLYGMNFDVLPELHWRYSYAVLWLVMLTLVVGLLGYFKRKGWF